MNLYKHLRQHWKPVISLLIFFASFTAFMFSTGILESHYPNVTTFSPADIILSSIYYSLSLFVLGGIDVGLPIGEALWVQTVLWLCYFLAPLISVSFIISSIQENLFDKVPGRIINHSAIFGFGRNGSVVYNMHRDTNPHDDIVIVDKQMPENKDEININPSTWILKNDFLKPEILRQIKIERANRIYITTNQDFVNIVCLSALLDYFQHKKMPLIICQISDPFFRKDIKKLFSHADQIANVKFYNGYKAASGVLFSKYIKPSLAGNDNYLHVFLGYGSFGFCLHEVMLGDGEMKNQSYVIGTKRKQEGQHNRWINAVESKITCRTLSCEIICTDVYDIDFWKRCNDMAESSAKRIVFYICTDDDLSNLQLAIMLKESDLPAVNKSLIFIRSFRPVTGMMKGLLESKITDGAEKDIVILPISEGLSEGFKKEFDS